MAILSTIISAFVGGLCGYFASRLQTDALISMKKDDIARSLAEASLEQMERVGISSDYSPLAHYAVHRRILEDFDVSKPCSLEEERDRMEAALHACESNRMVLYKSVVAWSDSQLMQKTIQSMRDEIKEYDSYIDTIPDTPEGKEYKKILRQIAESEKRRLDILLTMSLKKEINRDREKTLLKDMLKFLGKPKKKENMQEIFLKDLSELYEEPNEENKDLQPESSNIADMKDAELQIGRNAKD
jgi:hypothetical protein